MPELGRRGLAAIHLLAHELEVELQIGIARVPFFRLPISSDGASWPASLEPGVPQVVEERSGTIAGMDQLVVSSGSFGEFSLFIKFVALLEDGGRMFRAEDRQSRDTQHQKDQSGAKATAGFPLTGGWPWSKAQDHGNGPSENPAKYKPQAMVHAFNDCNSWRTFSNWGMSDANSWLDFCGA